MDATSYANEPAILLVREGAELPPDVATESQTFLSGWRVVKNFDNYVLRRKMRERPIGDFYACTEARKPD
jgi:hypothetical protein